jgi:hypothetical protein
MLNAVMLNVANKSFILNVILLNAMLLNVILLNVVKLSVKNNIKPSC